MKTKAYSYIRFSTPEQSKGDSLRRQKERSEEYARKKNLELDQSFKLEDLGISAFKGKNAVEGALAGFLQAVQTGKVKRGSYLIIESLDRLSRDRMSEAIPRFIDIINAGITIVTLIDEAEYNKENIDKEYQKIITAIVVMMRAHEESATKSERVSKAWEQKRKKAIEHGTPLTKRCPSWLILENGKYRKIESRVAVVKKIYKLAINGLGKRTIAKLLNKEGVETWGDGINKSRKANGWHDSYIQKILTNESVIGRYHIHFIDKETGKRVPTGEVVENYYPKIISEQDWNKVRNKSSSLTGKKGSKGKLSNLFTGIVFDGYNKASMRFVNKGSRKGHGKYLSSDITRIKPKTKGQNWSYHHFESAILNHMLSFDWSSLVDNKNNSRIDNLLEEEASLSRIISQEKDKIKKLLENFTDTDIENTELFKQNIININNSVKEREEKLLIIQSSISEIRESIDSYSEGFDEFKKLCLSEKIEDRIRLQTEIRKRIKKISLYRHGRIPAKISKQMHVYKKDNSHIVIEYKDVGLSVLSFSKIKPIQKTVILTRSPRRLKRTGVSDLIKTGIVPSIEKIKEKQLIGWESIVKEGYSHHFYY